MASQHQGSPPVPGHQFDHPSQSMMMKPPLKIVSKISQVINVYSQPQKKEFIKKLQKKGVFQQDVLSLSAQHIQMMA